ncbi:hypothetical protein ACFCXR_28460 [Streptomyces noursei]|uniref:hypothetical protein n=1 Tax=Streptomyces noursei TaxID=1971 RepID=UPI0035D6F37F
MAAAEATPLVAADPHAPGLRTRREGGQPGAKKAVQDIHNADDRDHAAQAIKTFAKLYGAKYPKAVKKITDGAGAE